MGFGLDILYAAGLTLSAPMWLYRMIRHGRYRSQLAARLGAVPIRHGRQPTVWLHGVSVGEVNAARTLVEEIHRQLPDLRVVVSSTTDTGLAAARRLYEPDHMVFQWPLDFSLAVRRALGRIRPDLVVLMEGEAWPNFLAECRRRGIPSAVVNGRMSANKGYPRYRRLGPLARWLFNRVSALCVQDESYAEMFRSLGVDPGRIEVTGMMKFDTAPVDAEIPGQAQLAEALGLTEGHRLIVAGGTGPGEEAICRDVFEHLADRHEDVVLAVVPRKPERFDEVARLLGETGRPVVRRSQRPDGSAAPLPAGAVVLGDTMGELRAFYALAEAVFVGRTLVPMGGSDMIEAAALAKPVAFGPHTFNFPQADALADHGCARVADADALCRQFDAWLSDPATARAAGEQARDHVRSRQGATRRNVEVLCRLLGREPARREGTIATDRIGDDTPTREAG